MQSVEENPTYFLFKLFCSIYWIYLQIIVYVGHTEIKKDVLSKFF